MTTYAAEVFVPGLTEAMARDVEARLRASCERLTITGATVRFLGVTLILQDQALLCRWWSDSEEAVRAVHALAGVDAGRLIHTVDIGGNAPAETPPPGGRRTPVLTDEPDEAGRTSTAAANDAPPAQ